MANFDATVNLPRPPLPEATPIIFFTFGNIGTLFTGRYIRRCFYITMASASINVRQHLQKPCESFFYWVGRG
jgi:hypothetical protein